jgi:hypothetical protein
MTTNLGSIRRIGEPDIEETSMRFARMSLLRLMLAVATVGALLGIGARAWRSHRLIESKKLCIFKDVADLARDYGDYTRIPLDGSRYLRGVAEPITPIHDRGVAGSDNHWRGVGFVDGKQVELTADYFIYVYMSSGGISETLMFGERKVPPRGPEELAFLGLLQRWYRQDAEARGFYDSLKRSDLPSLTERQRAKVTCVWMLRKLLTRD